MGKFFNRFLWKIIPIAEAVCLLTYVIIFCCLERKATRNFNVGVHYTENDDSCQGNNVTTFVSENSSRKHSFRHLSHCALKYITVQNKEDCRFKKFLKYKCEKCCCGGWGDRIKGIISAFLLALLTERVFVIDMKQPCELESLLDHRVYDWSICKDFVRSLNTAKFVSIRKSKKIVVPDISNLDLGYIWVEKVIEVTMRIYVIDEIRNYKYESERLRWMKYLQTDEIVHVLINTLFKEGHALLKSKEELLQNIGNKKLACAHIRIGKNPSNPQDTMVHNGIGKRQIEAIFSFLKAYALGSGYSIYIASDSANVKALAYKEHNMHTLNNTIVHIDLPVLDRYSVEVCQGFFTVLLEHYILESCDVLLLTRSNFGVTSAYMRGVSKGLYIMGQQNKIHKNGIIDVNLSDIQKVFGFN